MLLEVQVFWDMTLWGWGSSCEGRGTRSFEILGTANVVTHRHIQKTSFFSSGLVVSNYSFLLGTLKYQTCNHYNSVVLDSSLSFV